MWNGYNMANIYVKDSWSSKQLHKFANYTFHPSHIPKKKCQRKYVNEHLQFGNHATNKQTNITCLGSQLLHKKLTMAINISCAFVDIHRSKIHVANVGCTYVANFFSLIVSKTSSTNNLFDGKTTFMHNLYVGWCNQMDWTIIISKKTFIHMYNITSSKIQHVPYAIFGINL